MAEDTQLDEQRSLRESCSMISHIFTSIFYIRGFFAESVFEDDKSTGVPRKKIVRGVNQQADRLLNWVEEGCYDALMRKYLETVTLGVFLDPDEPDAVVESYTLTFAYPSSPEHELIASLRATADFTLKTGDGEKTIKAKPDVPFALQIGHILRTFICMIQELAPLPLKKYATMQITYYDELTPPEYEPPGFTATVFDVNYLFKKDTYKHHFGHVESGHHKIGLAMETSADAIEEELRKAEAAKVPKTLLEGADTQASIQLSHHGLVPEAPKVQAKAAGEPAEVKRDPFAAEAPNIKRGVGHVQCLCGDKEEDLDMIQCDRCKLWQHTPCAGYCTNKDKRLPDKHVCLKCEHAGKTKLLDNLKELARLRRAISIVYSEGLESIRWLSKRIGTLLVFNV